MATVSTPAVTNPENLNTPTTHSPALWVAQLDVQNSWTIVCNAAQIPHVKIARFFGPYAEGDARRAAAALNLIEMLKLATEALALAEASVGGEAMCKRGPLVAACRAAIAAAEMRGAA